MSHWYQVSDGAPMYTVIAKNGRERATTLADARKLNLVPSVTTVMDCQDKPALVEWKANQVMDACIKHPYTDNLDVLEWKTDIRVMSRQKGTDAADRGSEIHNALEYYYKTGKVQKDDEHIVVPVIEQMEIMFPGVKWIAEDSFAHPDGFGGKVDMHSPEGIVLDFKTKPSLAKMVAYDDHGMQTAAYTKGLMDRHGWKQPENVRRHNLFIHTIEPGVMKLTESSGWERDIGMFYSLLKFWQWKNKFYV